MEIIKIVFLFMLCVPVIYLIIFFMSKLNVDIKSYEEFRKPAPVNDSRKNIIQSEGNSRVKKIERKYYLDYDYPESHSKTNRQEKKKGRKR